MMSAQEIAAEAKAIAEAHERSIRELQAAGHPTDNTSARLARLIEALAQMQIKRPIL